ncbi:carotenoid biosynthesis protein [Demequina sp. NBRC 110054]|uniref:carotenoid biosynthesis protein n=1 Tax=Demequina sp. NBRC 110054 TaxID=1570343 RepID=UPI0013567129|nr:carotenoid biosynthesis protein [Demequina sp. NBRC 110054]
MIFGTPVSWFLFEVLSVAVFLAAVIHAAGRTKAKQHILVMIAFVIYAGAFENIGVWQNIYDYSTDRIMMIGKVPLSILLIEAVTLYCALWLAEQLRLPWWAGAFVAGAIGSLQDMTVDPSNVFDIHVIDGVASGQWNWTMHYEGGFFGIPVFNFSGWFTMMLYFALFVGLLDRLGERKGRSWLITGAPLLAIVPSLLVLVSPINLVLLFGWDALQGYGLLAESVMLALNFGVAIFLLFRYAKWDKPLDLKLDGVLLALPVIMHLWDIGLAFAAGIEEGYVPSLLFTAIHVALLAAVLRAGLRANAASREVDAGVQAA